MAFALSLKSRWWRLVGYASANLRHVGFPVKQSRQSIGDASHIEVMKVTSLSYGYQWPACQAIQSASE